MISLKNWCLWAVVLEKTLDSPLDSKEIKPVNPKEINPEYSLEGLMLKLKLLYFGCLMWRVDLLESPWCWERLKAKEEEGAKDEMVGRHHQLNIHESEQTQEMVKDKEGWHAAVHEVAKNRTLLSNWTTATTIRNYSNVWIQDCLFLEKFFQ